MTPDPVHSDAEGAPQTGLASAAHEAVRVQHRDERVEDYVEAIYRLQAQQQPVRVVDLQGVFGVSHVTVIRALERLERDGLVERGEEGLVLTGAGARLAEACYERHRIVEGFLRALGVSAEAALRDAEGIEHHLGEESLRAMQRFVRQREEAEGTNDGDS
jgi:DtxR family transcriptional regulator, manganese transport regulator